MHCWIYGINNIISAGLECSTKVDCVTSVPSLCEAAGNIALITAVHQYFVVMLLLLNWFSMLLSCKTKCLVLTVYSLLFLAKGACHLRSEITFIPNITVQKQYFVLFYKSRNSILVWITKHRIVNWVVSLFTVIFSGIRCRALTADPVSFMDFNILYFVLMYSYFRLTSQLMKLVVHKRHVPDA
jgi:hypothetical protein